jgi:hypothetical protein
MTLESRIVWLFGSPRSGSTWVRQMAAEHPAIVVMDEPTIGYHLSPFLSNEPGYHAEDLDLSTFTLRRVVQDNPNRFFATAYEDVWLPDLRRMLGNRLLAHLERERGPQNDSDALLLVKEPNGSQSADLIMRAQPEARLLFLLRDGRDVVDSELASFAVGGWQERSFAHMRGVSADERIDFVVRSAHQWLWRTEIVEAAFAAHRGPKLLLRYEEMLREPERHVGELFAWLGLSLAADDLRALVERFAFERLEVRGPGQHNRSATPGAWRENLNAEEREALERILGAKLRELGYAEP